jgi:thymidylate synthase (FAD)
MDIITGGKPEDARYLLPNASKTEIVVTLNLRMWRHVFRERALNPKAQWEIRGIFLTLYELYDDYLPCVFGDLKNENV